MAHLIYSAISSLDGYIEDMDGKFDWAEPDEEVHQYINDLERSAGTYLYGRRMYETMMFWETDPNLAAMSPIYRDFAEIWQAADKIIYSRTLEHISTRKTRMERVFDPEAVRQLKASAGQDILIGGPASSRPRVQGWLDRRVPSIPRTDPGGRWQTCAPEQYPPGARTSGGTPLSSTAWFISVIKPGSEGDKGESVNPVVRRQAGGKLD